MNQQERQEVADMVELGVHRYFDHYLTDVFPQQLDRFFENHNADGEAHPRQFKALTDTKRKVDRVFWMVAGISALIGALATGLAVLDHCGMLK